MRRVNDDHSCDPTTVSPSRGSKGASRYPRKGLPGGEHCPPLNLHPRVNDDHSCDPLTVTPSRGSKRTSRYPRKGLSGGKAFAAVTLALSLIASPASAKVRWKPPEGTTTATAAAEAPLTDLERALSPVELKLYTHAVNFRAEARIAESALKLEQAKVKNRDARIVDLEARVKDKEEQLGLWKKMADRRPAPRVEEKLPTWVWPALSLFLIGGFAGGIALGLALEK